MIDKKLLKKAEKILKEFFKKTTFDIDFELKQASDGAIEAELKTEEPQVWIGEQGKTLAALQNVLGRILRQQLGEHVYLHVDINQYKKNKEQYLREAAREIADRVALDKNEKALSAMSSYERRIIHMELADRVDIKTESIGQSPDRRVVIKPA